LIRFLPVVIAILAAAYGFVELRTSRQVESISTSERTYLQHITGFLAAEVSNSLDHVDSLTREAAVIDAVSRPDPQSLETLQGTFLTLARRNPSYQQIRWIDATGMERVRIERRAGQLVTVAAPNLQDKSDRYYFATSAALRPGELYISRLDLNVENGVTEQPARPVLRIAAPVADRQGHRHGVLIINIAVRFMLDVIRSTGGPSNETHYILLNQAGQWLSEPRRPENSLVPGSPGSSFAKLVPAAWQQISKRPSGSVELADGLWVWETLSPAEAVSRLGAARPTDTDAQYRLTSDDTALKLVANTPIAALIELRRDTRMPVALGVALILVAYALSLVFYLRGQMAEKQAALNVAHAMAYASSMQRLKELDERFRLLVQASSVGLVVVNSDGDILMANPAAETLFGYDPGELEGHSVDELLPRGLRRSHSRFRAGYFANPAVRRMGEGRELRAVTRDQRSIPVEIGLSPFQEHGRHLVLASVIDLSERHLAAEAIAERQALEQRFAQIVEALPGVVCSWRRGADGKYSMPYASPGLRDLYGVDPEAVKKDADAILARIHPDDLPRVVDSIEASARSLSLWNARFRIIHPSAGERWIEGWSSPRAQADGSLLWHGYLLDVSNQKAV